MSQPNAAKELATPPAAFAKPAAAAPGGNASAASATSATTAASSASSPAAAHLVADAASGPAVADGAVRQASATLPVAGPAAAKPGLPEETGAATDVAGVLQYAIAHHPMLRIRQSEIDAARAKLVTAGLLPNPELTLDAGSYDSEAGPGVLNARLMFKVPLGPKREWRTAAAASGIRESELCLSRETKLVLSEAADAAIDVLYRQELLVVYGQLSDMAGRVVAIQKERFQAAAVPYRSVVLTQMSASDIELARQMTLERLGQAKIRLARAMGLCDGAPPPLTGGLQVEPVAFAPLSDVLARARHVAPELAQSQAAVQQNQEQLALEKWKALPDLAIGPHWEGQLGSPSENRVSARAIMDLPIFDRNQGHIAQQAADLQTSCARQSLTEVTTLNDVAMVYVELQNVQTQADYYRLHIKPLLQQTETALRGAFEDRVAPAYELVDLLEYMVRMRLHDVEVRYQHQRLRTQLEVLLECPLARAGAGQVPAEAIPVPASKVPAPPAAAR
jgi:cobalt-zinc-cadmium efflux system outer membrane protein